MCHSPFGKRKAMYNYYFDLIGLRFKLQATEPVSITDRFSPFVCSKADNNYFTININICDTLPYGANSAIWHGITGYNYKNNIYNIFHTQKPEEAPFAVTQFKENGNIELYTLKQYSHFFNNTSGIFNHISMENLLLQHNSMLLHASFINFNRNGILFTGPSGVGKSTQAMLWEKYMNAEIINGDRAALRKTELGWTAWGSPYAGTSGIYRNESAPVKALVILKQSKTNKLSALSSSEAMCYIYPEISSHPWDKNFVTHITTMILDLTSSVPVFLLECRPDEASVKLLKEGINL